MNKRTNFNFIGTIILSLLVLSIISAGEDAGWTIDNLKDVSKTKFSLGFPEITIRNSILWIFPRDPILDTKITSHTTKCANGKCLSEQTMKLYYNAPLIDDVKFIDSNGKNINVPYSLYTIEEEDYTIQEMDYVKSHKVCVPKEVKGDFVSGDYCYYDNLVYKNVTKTRQIEVPYIEGTKKLGDKINPIEHKVIIKADISGYKYVDYIFESNGISLNELAPWTTANCFAGGDSVYIDGDYCVNVFTNNGTFAVTKNTNISTLVIAGGGGGGGRYNAGGGGAGGVNYTSNFDVTIQTYAVKVGKGGRGGAATDGDYGINGANSTFGNIITVGGGAGNAIVGAGDHPGFNGGSGGGAAAPDPSSGGLGVTGQGNNGGASASNNGGGGGGAGQAGKDAAAGYGGSGGNGTQYDINGTLVWYAGGGGGSAFTPDVKGIGGLGGGGDGNDVVSTAIGDGVNGTGGGGGGNNRYGTGIGGNGGSGIVIMRYPAFELELMTTAQSYPAQNYNASNSLVGIGCNFTGNVYNNISSVILNVYDHSNTLDYTNTEVLAAGIASYNKSWTTTALTDDTYNWSCTGLGNGGKNDTSINRTFFLDATPPTISILTPSGNQGIKTIPYDVTLNASSVDTHLQSCAFNWSFDPTLRNTPCGILNTTSVNISGTQRVYYRANDSFGNSFVNYSDFFIITSINSESYNTTSVETALESFMINTTIDSSIYTSSTGYLIYNGTSYLGTKSSEGLNSLFVRSINIPITNGTTTNFNFYWTLVLVNATSTIYQNSTTHSQTINPIDFGICDYNYRNVTYINFSMKDQSNMNPLNASLKIFFQLYSGAGLSKRNITYQDLNEVNMSHPFCAYPSDKTYLIDTQLEYYKTNYATNYYYINGASISNNTNNITLYLLNDTLATATILRVRDHSSVAVPNVYITIQRYDIGTDTYYTIGVAKTDYLGQDLVYLNWYDTLYKFIGTQDSSVVFTTTPYKISSTPQTFTTSATTTYTYDKFDNLQYTLTYNNVTSNFVLTYINPSSLVTSCCLKVIKFGTLEQTVICNTCDTSASATLYCNIGAYGNGTFTGIFYATGSISDIARLTITKFSDDIYNALGNVDGTFYAIIGSGIVMVMFLITPALGIIGALLGLLFAMLLGFTNINIAVFSGITIVGIIIIWTLKR